MNRGGLEPPTRLLRVNCSTIELPVHGVLRILHGTRFFVERVGDEGRSSGDGALFRVRRKTAQTGVSVLLGAEFGG